MPLSQGCKTNLRTPTTYHPMVLAPLLQVQSLITGELPSYDQARPQHPVDSYL